MKKKKVIVSTLSEDVFTDVENKFEELGVCIIEERYDLLSRRYELYARVNLRQSYKLRRFIKSCDANIIEID